MIEIYKVVIIDDEPVIVTVLRQSVNWGKYGCVVAGTANDAQSGAAAVRAHKPDILFTDIRMPKEDGLTMLAGLKSEFPDMQVTILTGYREFEYARRAIDLSAVRFLVKPAKPAEIEEAIEAMTKNLQAKPKRQAAKAKDIEPAVALNADIMSEEGQDSSNFVVNAAIRHIKQSCTEKLTLSEVADRIYVSQWHLSKLLSRYVNKSFYDLLNEARIEQAKELLQDPQFTISSVSDMVGFTDASHFTHVFKRIENTTPKAFRNTLTQFVVHDD